jgi:hypothetical protein
VYTVLPLYKQRKHCFSYVKQGSTCDETCNICCDNPLVIPFEITNFREQNLSPGTNSHSASQEICRVLCNPKVHFLIYSSQPPLPIVSQISPIHTITSYFSKNNFNYFYEHMNCMACVFHLILLGQLNQGGVGGLDMRHACGRGEVFTGFRLGGQKGGGHW